MEETHEKNVRVSNLYIDQKANSRVNHNIITLHNGVTRNRTDLSLSGEGAECVLNGCAIADKNQVVDNNTLIEHIAPHCDSKELYKYVLDGKAIGRIDVYDYYAYAAVPRQQLAHILAKLDGEKIKGKKTRFEAVR